MSFTKEELKEVVALKLEKQAASLAGMGQNLVGGISKRFGRAGRLAAARTNKQLVRTTKSIRPQTQALRDLRGMTTGPMASPGARRFGPKQMMARENTVGRQAAQQRAQQRVVPAAAQASPQVSYASAGRIGAEPERAALARKEAVKRSIQKSQQVAAPAAAPGEFRQGLNQRMGTAGDWIKANPGKAALIGGGALLGTGAAAGGMGYLAGRSIPDLR